MSSAWAAMRKIPKPEELGEDEREAEPAPAEDAAVLLEVDDPLEAHRAGLDDDADHGQDERQLVGDELGGGPQRPEQGVLVGAGPAGHEDADDRQRRDRQGVEHAGVEVGHDEAGAGRDDDVEQEGRDQHDHRRGGEHPPVGLGRDDVLLLDELDAVADELEPAVEPAGVHRPQPALHVAHHLEQEDVAQDERPGRDDRQDDDRLEGHDSAPGDVDGSGTARRAAVTGRCPPG